MEMQQLRAAVALADDLSFTLAATRLGVTQSSLSHLVTRLERSLGVQLFARTSRRVALTAAGMAFVADARESVLSADRAKAAALAANGTIEGTLRIGVIPSVEAVTMGPALYSYRERYGAVRVNLSVGASDRTIDLLQRGALDVGFVGLSAELTPTGVRSYHLGRERHVAVVPLGHRLADRGEISFEDLRDEVFVDFPERTPGRVQSDAAAAEAGVVRDVAYEVDSASMLCDFVESGLAVGIVPVGVAQRHPGIAAIAMTNGPQRREWLVWADFNPSPAASAFVDHIRSLVEAGTAQRGAGDVGPDR